MKIIELKSSNIKRLKAVELTIDEKQNLVMITGKNAQGKTSILDSIWYALGGKKAVQDKPVRDGEEKGEIEINVDGYMVKRTFTDKGSYLQVTNKEGAKYSNPQEFLDFIIGNLSFDPLEFSRMDNKKKIEELTKIVGIDLGEFDQKKKDLTQDRLLVGREQKSLGSPNEETILSAQAIAGRDEISVSDLVKKLEEESAKRTEFTHHLSKIEMEKTYIKEAEQKIIELQEGIKKSKERITEFEKVEDTKEDLEAIKKQIDSAEKINSETREAKQIVVNYQKVIDKKKEYDDLTEKIKLVDDEKAKKLSEAKMPIDGLSWEEDSVLYNGIPYDQISAAEQLKVSMAIAMASNPKLKVILIRDGSLLDKDNLKVIESMAKDNDFQVWVESVDDSGKIGIYIEDGEVKSIN